MNSEQELVSLTAALNEKVRKTQNSVEENLREVEQRLREIAAIRKAVTDLKKETDPNLTMDTVEQTIAQAIRECVP